MKKLMDSKPDVKAFLGNSYDKLKIIGIDPDSIATLKDLTDLLMILKALESEKTAKDYIDEQYDREASLELMNQAVSPSSREPG